MQELRAELIRLVGPVATWIADLWAHGLIRSSFVPPQPVQELRDLTRTRRQLAGEVAQHILRIQKTLENANLKLTGGLTDILGVSGRAILQALVAGETKPEHLAQLVPGPVKASRTELMAALGGVRRSMRWVFGHYAVRIPMRMQVPCRRFPATLMAKRLPGSRGYEAAIYPE